MEMTGRFRGFVAVCLAALAIATTAQARPPQWVETFQSSPAAYGVNAPETWTKETVGRIASVTGTLRFQFPVSVGGSQLRIRLSNETGTRPLKVGAVSVALSRTFDGNADAIVPMTFGGAAGATIPTGAPLISDAVVLPVKAGDQVLISVYVPEGVDLDNYGATGMWVALGDQTGSLSMPEAKMIIGRPLVSGVSVSSTRKMPVVVAVGDSITAGGRKVPDELHSWPEALSRRLNADGKNRVAVVNAGIAGNRFLSDGYGSGLLARFDRDVLRIDGVTHVIVLAGINDIGFPGREQFGITQPEIQLNDLIEAYRQIITRSHARGLKVIGGTLLPFEGAFYYSPAKEEMRRSVNEWVRTSAAFDAVIDFEAVMRDPDSPQKLRFEYDSGDHLHPNLAGQKVMGDAIDAHLLH